MLGCGNGAGVGDEIGKLIGRKKWRDCGVGIVGLATVGGIVVNDLYNLTLEQKYNNKY